MDCLANQKYHRDPCFATGKNYAYLNLKEKYNEILDKIEDDRLSLIIKKIIEYLSFKQSSYSKCMMKERDNKCKSTSGKVNIDFKKIDFENEGDEEYFFKNKYYIDELLYPSNPIRTTRRASIKSPSPINSISSRTRSKSKSKSRRKSNYGGKKSKRKYKNKQTSQKKS
jgi:hypothetical protein